MTTLVFPNGLFNYSSHLIRARIFNQINPNKDFILDIRKMVWGQVRKCVYQFYSKQTYQITEAKTPAEELEQYFPGLMTFIDSIKQ
jgi:hypothetical protein